VERNYFPAPMHPLYAGASNGIHVSSGIMEGSLSKQTCS